MEQVLLLGKCYTEMPLSFLENAHWQEILKFIADIPWGGIFLESEYELVMELMQESQ